MKRSWLVTAVIVVVAGGLLALGYTHRSKSSGENITAVGSTALQPLVEAAGEQFAANHLGVFINVQGGGSGTGLAQIQAGAVNLGNSDLFAEEKDGIDASNIVDHKVAVVGVAPIVNKQAGITNLSTKQLTDIFTKKDTNWNQVGGKNLPIVLVNRVAGSGTRATFEKWGLNGAQSAEAQEQDSSGMVRSIVSTTPGAISYVAFSYFDHTVDVPTVNNVKPTNKNVLTNNWKIWSYEHVYTHGPATGKVKEFINYLMSDKVQKTIVPQLGYISPHDMKIERTVDGKVTPVH